jgi:hypothetical protein
MDPIERRAAANRSNIVPQVIRPQKPSAPPKSVRVAGTPGTFARQEAATTSRTGTITPTFTPTPTPVNNTSSSQVQYGAQTVDNPAPFNIDEVPIETLERTPEYMARERALQNQLELFRQQQATGRTRFDEDLNRSFSELGFDPTSGKFDLGELLSSGQRATTSGQAFQALRNDFAARGMLQSGAYEARKGVLRDQLMKQQQELEGRRTRFGQDQTAALVAQEEQAKAQRDAALDEARQALMVRMGMGG